MSKQTHTLGSGPVEEAYAAKMRAIAHVIDDFLNPTTKDIGFILMVFPFTHDGRCNYMSNAERADVVKMLREQLRYFEGAPDNVSGRG